MSFKYDVFTSYRGEDTRENVHSHLEAALRRRGIKTYTDDDLEKGGGAIAFQLFQAIEDSKLFLIIFSENFARSSWCLKELEKILQSRKNYGQIVIPIFYGVNPSDVRRQEGTYEEAFHLHGERFPADRVQRWRVALRETADLASWSSTTIKREAKLVDIIVQDVKNKLRYPSVKAGLDWFAIMNFMLELPLAVSNQLSSVKKPHYALAAMIISVFTVIACVIHLICRGQAERVHWLWKWPVPWFYQPSPDPTRFGVFTEIVGLICALCQCIMTTIAYSFLQRNAENPIKIAVWSIAFASGLLCSVFMKKPDKRPAHRG